MAEYISREDAVDELQVKVFHNLTDEYYGTMQVLNELPAADLVPVVHAKWIPYRCDMYECSACGRIHTSFDNEECDANYCPHCGAKMDGGES